MNLCQECNTNFVPGAGSTGKFCSMICYGAFSGRVRHQKSLQKYSLNPKFCTCCNKPIDYHKRNRNKFCCSSCAATYNNARKDYTKIKTGPIPKPKTVKVDNAVWGPFTRIYLCTCKISGKKWFSSTIKTIHPTTTTTKKLYAYQCRFRFSISAYPDWFAYATNMIDRYGWYRAANRGSNLDGCSRDHLYSVTDGFINNIDPKIIAHPANCEIVTHRKNQRKHKSSSITIHELYQRIKAFEEKYGEDNWNSTNLSDFADRCLMHSAISS